MAHYAAYRDDDPELFQVKRRPVRASRRAWPMRVVVTCMAVAALLAIGNLALSWSKAIGDAGGRVADSTLIALQVGDHRLSIPANMFRFGNQRNLGPHERVDLAVHWPTLEGYSTDRRDDFLDASLDAPILFMTIRKRESVSDSAGRLASVYRHFFDDAPLPAPQGLIGHRLTIDSGLAGEEVYFEAGSTEPFTTHCLATDAKDYPALCLTEVHAGADLSVQVRFRKGLLADWAEIKSATRLMLLRFGVVS